MAEERRLRGELIKIRRVRRQINEQVDRLRREMSRYDPEDDEDTLDDTLTNLHGKWAEMFSHIHFNRKKLDLSDYNI